MKKGLLKIGMCALVMAYASLSLADTINVILKNVHPSATRSFDAGNYTCNYNNFAGYWYEGRFYGYTVYITDTTGASITNLPSFPNPNSAGQTTFNLSSSTHLTFTLGNPQITLGQNQNSIPPAIIALMTANELLCIGASGSYHPETCAAYITCQSS